MEEGKKRERDRDGRVVCGCGFFLLGRGVKVHCLVRVALETR